MCRKKLFTVRVNAEDRAILRVLATRLERQESDLIRWLIREKARELGLISDVPIPATDADAD